MKKLLFSAAALALTAGSALAADLPSRKAEPVLPPPPPPMWSGFYVGLNAGWAGTTSSSAPTVSAPIADNMSNGPLLFSPAGWGTPLGWTSFANLGTANVNQTGFIGGGQVGYNYQWGQSWLVGLEADFSGTTVQGRGNYLSGIDVTETTACCNDNAVGAGAVNAGINWMGTVRGRLGYIVTPTVLLYGTGGLAYAGAYASAAHSFVSSEYFPLLGGGYGQYVGIGASYGSRSNTLVGWTAGGGLEWMFMPNWSLKAEALYYNLGNIQFASSPLGILDPVYFGPANPINVLHVPATRVTFDGVIARAGVNYHFNWGAAPVVAKY